MLWGGDFTGTPDPMHFEIHLPPSAITSAASGTAAMGNIPNVGSGVERWRDIVLRALEITGQSASWANAVLYQMQTESSGDPNAINLTDSNAQRGTPSKGLLQVIDPTFRSYALAPYNQNIWDPLSNIIAAIRYVMARYGSIAAGMQGHAYDTGGILSHMGLGVNLSGKPERVLSPSQTAAFDTLVTTLTNDSAVPSTQQGLSSADLSAIVDAIREGSTGTTERGDVHVRVFIGQTELSDLIVRQVSAYDSDTARMIQLGRKP